jgi:hypothetical protein
MAKKRGRKAEEGAARADAASAKRTRRTRRRETTVTTRWIVTARSVTVVWFLVAGGAGLLSCSGGRLDGLPSGVSLAMVASAGRRASSEIVARGETRSAQSSAITNPSGW